MLRDARPWASNVPTGGSAHRRSQLFDDEVMRLDLDAQARVGDVLDRLRALTTDRISEAAWFESEGRRFRVQVHIEEERG